MTQKGLPVRQAGLAPILIVLLLAVALMGSFYLGTLYQLNKNSNLYDNPASLWPTLTDQSLQDWNIYINPKFKFAFKYPKIGIIDEGVYDPLGRCRGLYMYPNGDIRAIENKLYDTQIIILCNKIEPNTKTKDFAKENSEFGQPFMELVSDKNYHTITIDGHEATTVDYMLTDEIDKALNDMDIRTRRLPKGYKTKIVYIKNGDVMLIIKAGSLLYKEDADQFDQILSTFKFTQ